MMELLTPWIWITLGAYVWLQVGWWNARRFYDHWHASFPTIKWGDTREVSEIWAIFLAGPIAWPASIGYDKAGDPYIRPGSKSLFRNRKVLP